MLMQLNQQIQAVSLGIFYIFDPHLSDSRIPGFGVRTSKTPLRNQQILELVLSLLTKICSQQHMDSIAENKQSSGLHALCRVIGVDK